MTKQNGSRQNGSRRNGNTPFGCYSISVWFCDDRPQELLSYLMVWYPLLCKSFSMPHLNTSSERVSWSL